MTESVEFNEKEVKRKLMAVLKKSGHFNRLSFAYIFGSQVEGKASRRSDIDICLYYDIKNLETLKKLLFRIRGRMPERYDISMFQLLPLRVKKEIFKGRPVFLKGRKLPYDIAFTVFREYEEFAPRYKFIVMNTKSNSKRFML